MRARPRLSLPEVLSVHKANLNLLPTLKVLLETRNISRAAELLHLSQPSISKQLGQLRSEFGDELLVRRAALAADPAGREPGGGACRLLGALERLYAAPEFAPERCERVFRLASSDYVAQHILPDICAALARAAPWRRWNTACGTSASCRSCGSPSWIWSPPSRIWCRIRSGGCTRGGQAGDADGAPPSAFGDGAQPW